MSLTQVAIVFNPHFIVHIIINWFATISSNYYTDRQLHQIYLTYSLTPSALMQNQVTIPILFLSEFVSGPGQGPAQNIIISNFEEKLTLESSLPTRKWKVQPTSARSWTPSTTTILSGAGRSTFTGKCRGTFAAIGTCMLSYWLSWTDNTYLCIIVINSSCCIWHK